MKLNKKILCLFIVLIALLAINAVSAAENTSDIVASDAAVSDIVLSQGIDESLGAADTFVITNQTFSNYFTAEGELNNNVSAGSTLDFQGTFTGEDYKVNITKPVNIISSTEDAVFNEIGKKDSTGGCFHISASGSGTNVSDINFINSAFYVTGASDVSIEKIHMVANMPGVGSGTGFMCVQAGSRFVTIKNSYFENRGTGSSIAVFGYADYCTFEKNEVVINGSSGNAVYITTYVPAKYVGSDPTGNIISNNYIHGGASTFCMALVVAGNNNIIDNNLIDYNGAGGIASQSPTTENNTYTDNVLKGGCSFAAGENSYVAGNIVDGTITAGSNSEIRDNKMDALSLSKANVVVDGNVIGEYQVTLNENAFNTTMTNNIIFSKVNVNSKNNTIKNNTVEADDEYAIDLYQTTGNVVAYNNLVSNSFAGDAAVNGTENNEVYENGDVGNIVTEDNFFNFFDENGNYIRNFTELFFMGGFDSLVDVITINQSLTIQSIDASLKNMAFCLLGDDIVLNGLELELYDVPVSNNGSAILINGGKGITIENMGIICAYDKTADVYAIHAENAEDLYVFGNTIYFDVATNGSNVNNAVYVLNSSDILLEGNIIHCFIPSCQVPWKEIPPVGWVKFPLSEGLVFDGCSELEISDNEIYLGYNDVVGDYDTIYAIDIKDCQDVDFNDNRVTAYGHSYIYGLYAEADGLKINNNNFLISSDINYANGIEIEASRDAVISNNHLDVTAPSVAYPIYSGMNGGELEADYINNVIDAEADIVYGMELCGTLENVIGNTINVEGNRTTALAVKSKESNIINNTLNALGIDLGNSTTTESFEPMTAAINMVDSSAIIEGNEIYSNSKGIVLEGEFAWIEKNVINVTDNGLDDSYGILAEGIDITIFGNNITYVGSTEGKTINNAVNLKDCIEPLVQDNIMDIFIPSCYVDWKEVPPASGIWVKFPVSEGLVFTNCSDLDLIGNEISVQVYDVIGAFDTIYCIDIKDSENVNVSQNYISGVGCSYIYGLYIEANDSAVDDNSFIIKSDNYADAIEIEASINTEINNNYIEVESPVVAYGIYSGMNGGDLEVEYFNNTILATSDIVYGMELCGTAENVQENVITVIGNKTTGIAAKSEDINIFINEINALGENLGNSTTTESFEPMTVGIHLIGANARIDRNTIVSNSRGIVAENGRAIINRNIIDVEDNGLDDSYGILAEGADIAIFDNTMPYVGSTEGKTINNAVNLKDCIEPLVQDNIMDIFIPSCYVDWKEVPPASGIWVKFPVSEGLVFTNCSDLDLIGNEISVQVYDVIGAFDTIYCIDIKDSENVNVSQNYISGVGCSYIYGLYIEANDSAVDDNSFIIKSDNYADAIEIEASINTEINNNYIEVESPVVAYGIYSGMNGGDLEVEYFNNTILATSDIVYGMELCGTAENVQENVITVIGNKTTGIAAKSEDINIFINEINALGENLGNSTTTESFEPMTVGIHLLNAKATVERNTINSNSRGIVAENGYAIINRNEINVTDNGLDDSYGILAEGTDITIYNNNITYVGNTDGKKINNAVNLKDCIEPLVQDNIMDIFIPSCYVDWKEVPPASGIWVKFPVSEGLVFTNCSDLDLIGNEISVQVYDVIGAFDTIYCIDIKDSENVNVSQNYISGVGCSYIYGLYIEANDSAVDDNSFIIKSDNYADAIEIEASINTEINNNYIEVESPVVAYGIYSGMNGGDLEVEYFNNTILATSDIVYGMELCGTAENVQENVITVIGNKTTGIAAKSEDINIFINEINALGENLGNSTTTESFEPMTAGIHLLNANATVDRNTINSNSRGIVAENGRLISNRNVINVEDNGLDDSYAILAEGTNILIFDSNITYVGNTTGKTINNAINLKDCFEPFVMDNEFNITVPSCAIDWKEVPPASGNWVSTIISEGIVIDSSDLYLLDNNIDVNYDGVVGEYDTIYAVDIKSNNSLIKSNKINAKGHSYIYGLLVSGDNFTVENNDIIVESDEFYANGIDIEGPAKGVVKGNNISNYAPGVVYPIYSAMSNGNVTADYLNNTIYSNADLAYAMELDGLKENVEGNNILVSGQKVIGIYSLSKDITVKDNKMYVISNDTSSTAFQGRLGNATITDNNFTIMGEYTIDVTAINALVKDNYLEANALTGDASVNYDPETSSVYNNTPKMDKYFLTSEGLEKYFGNAKQLEFMLSDSLGNPVSNKSIIITINGRNYTRVTDENGTARININLDAGNYTVTATYADKDNNISADADVTILTTIEGKDITKIYRNGTQYYANFTDSDGNPLKNTDVMFNINGVLYTRKTNENGTAKLNINLSPGEYIITAYNTKTGENTANNITVLSSIVNNKDLTKYYKNASQYVVKILDAKGNPAGAGEKVTFNINGVLYTRQTNASGDVKLNINLQPGEYIITADYNGCMVSNKITVLPVLITKDLSMKYRDGSTFNATLLDGQGKPSAYQKVEFNINGVFYYRTTGSNGVAKLNINLMPGEYIITSSFDGSSVANKITISG